MTSYSDACTVLPRVNLHKELRVSPWVPNAFALFLLLGATGALGLALLWRVGSWQLSPAATLNEDEGLPIAASAPEIAGSLHGQDIHLTLKGTTTFLVFGTDGCAPCAELLEVAADHPATRGNRRVYFGGAHGLEIPADVEGKWEIYAFHDELETRKLWRAPVSPYFHVIDADVAFWRRASRTRRRI